MKNISTISTGVTGALLVLNRIARANGDSVKSVTIDADSTEENVFGLVTLKNKRSRKPFNVKITSRQMTLEFMGTKLAA